MTPTKNEPRESHKGRILKFPAPFRRKPAKSPTPSAVNDLREFEQDAEPDDYRRRMTVNAIAFAFVALLTLAGLWLAESLAALRKTQDCVAQGRRNCAEIDYRSTR